MAITDEDLGFLLMQRLAASSPVSALVSTRIKPDTLDPNETMPAITYEQVASEPWHHLGGSSGEARTRMQFNCYGSTRTQANQVAAAVKNRLDGFRGDVGSITVSSCVADNEFDRVDPPPPGGKQWRRRRALDFVIVHTEPTPTLS